MHNGIAELQNELKLKNAYKLAANFRKIRCWHFHGKCDCNLIENELNQKEWIATETHSNKDGDVVTTKK